MVNSGSIRVRHVQSIDIGGVVRWAGRPRRRASIGLVSAVLLVASAGCAGADAPSASPSATSSRPSPSSTSASASAPSPTSGPSGLVVTTGLSPQDAAVVREAEAGYRRYIEVTDAIGHRGFPPKTLRAEYSEVTTGDELVQMVGRGLEDDAGHRLTGRGRVVPLAPASLPRSVSPNRVIFDACLDVSAYSLLDPNGKSVTVKGGPDRYRQIVTMVREAGKWKVAQVDFLDVPC